MAMRGQRFNIDLDSDEESIHVQPPRSTRATGPNLGLLRDITERVPASDAKSPSPPKFKGSETGFPVHKTRVGPSKFKRNRETQASPDQLEREQTNKRDGNRSLADGLESNVSHGSEDKSIDQENKQRLAQMSDEEIEEARRELMSGLSPSLIEKLLKKANIDDDDIDSNSQIQISRKDTPQTSKFPTMNAIVEQSNPSSQAVQDEQIPSGTFSPDDPPLHLPPDLRPATSQQPLPPVPDIHFPQPPKPPDLDPSDPDFLSALHSKYFPSLPADPSTLAWMAPISSDAQADSVYSPSQQSYTPSALRFDFRGHLLPPRLSSQIPTTKGLHHHGHAPNSAGYTIPELAHLARSTYPAQRCIAYQTLGRILYRLGRGDFGQEGEDLCEGLWQLVDQGKVIENLVTAAGKGEEGGNRTVWVTATDAVWLWRKGGGRRWRGR